MAAQLCKADRGELAVQRGKLDLVCSLLISAGILDQGVGGEISVSRSDTKQSAVADHGVRRVALEEKINCVESAAADQDVKRAALEEKLKRVESTAKEAREDGQRATTVAVEATKIAEKVASQCREVDAKCDDAGTRSSMLESALDESRRRTEANSTRIFELTAEVERLERLAESNRNSLELVVMPLANRDQKTSYSASEVVADFISQEKRLEESASPGLVAAQVPEEEPREGRGTPGLTPEAEGSDSEERGGVTTDVLVGASEPERIPRRPGVLDAPGPQGHPEIDTRKHTTTPISRRRSTRTGRRVLSGNKRPQGVDPVRPKVSRPRTEEATPNSWARASWPSLSNEKGPFVRLERCLSDKAVTEADKNLLEESSKPITTLSPAHYGEQLQQTTGIGTGHGYTPLPDDPRIGGCEAMIDVAPRDRHAGGGNNDDKPHVSPHESGSTPSASVASPHHPRSTNSQHQEPQDLTTTVTTVKEASALLGTLASVRRDVTCGLGGLGGALGRHHDTEGENSSEGDFKVCGTTITGSDGGTIEIHEGRADFRGGRLAYLEGAPKLWRPRDTWDFEAASASGSSSSAELQ